MNRIPLAKLGQAWNSSVLAVLAVQRLRGLPEQAVEFAVQPELVSPLVPPELQELISLAHHCSRLRRVARQPELLNLQEQRFR